jgi:YfiH family protein
MTTLTAEPIVRSRLLSEVPGLVHGFTTRALGSMAGQLHAADEQARNRARLEARIGMRLVKASQVHSADVALVVNGTATRLRDGHSEPASNAMRLEADALITRDRGVALAVAVADCASILVATPDGWIGAAHAGWEGATRRIAVAMCEAIAERGGRVDEARGAIGPAICGACYAIDAARAAVIHERLGDSGSLGGPFGDRHHFDIPRELAAQLRDAGVPRVDDMRRCTKDEVETFFSHRGENGTAGRGLAFIGRPSATTSNDELERRNPPAKERP